MDIIGRSYMWITSGSQRVKRLMKRGWWQWCWIVLFFSPVVWEGRWRQSCNHTFGETCAWKRKEGQEGQGQGQGQAWRSQTRTGNGSIKKMILKNWFLSMVTSSLPACSRYRA